MERTSGFFWRSVIAIGALSAFGVAISCNTAVRESDPTLQTATPSTTESHLVKKATGTVVGTALAFPKDQEMVELTLIYRVRLDDGSEVSAKPLPQESPTRPGTRLPDDKGKRVELESLSDDEAKEAMAPWKIVRILEPIPTP